MATKNRKSTQEEGLRLASKLKRNHLESASQKMIVNLSAQALSNSTAQAIGVARVVRELSGSLQ